MTKSRGIGKGAPGVPRPWLKGRIPWNKGTSKYTNFKCVCSESFYVKDSQLKFRNPIYCSQKCYNTYTKHNRAKGKRWKLTKEQKIAISKRQIGEKNHNWHGGITNIRRNLETKRWRRKILKRDGRICRVCDSNKDIIVHHLWSYNKYPKQRNELSNGLTLCKKCHYEFHKTYGFGDNSVYQFMEWLNGKDNKNRERIIEKISNL